MIFGQHHPDTIKIIFIDKCFSCNDLEAEDRVDSRARPKVEEFVNELNKQKKGVCITFPYYIFLFLFVYIGSYIAVFLTGTFYLMFIPILAFIIFIAGIIWFPISYSRFFKKVNKTVDRYRVELSPYYTLMNNVHMNQKNSIDSSNEKAIYLFPRNGENAPESSNIFRTGRVNTQEPIYNLQGYYNPNIQQGHYDNININNNQSAHQIQELNPEPIDNQVYNPPPNIPIYTYYPQKNNDDNSKDYEAKIFENKDKKAK